MRIWNAFRSAVTAALVALLCACNFSSSGFAPPAPTPGLRAPREIASVRGVVSFELRANIDPSNGLPAFIFQGDYGYAPTIRVKPGDEIVVDLSDQLPPGRDMSGDVNLHFHGLGVSPRRPSDDVLTMLAHPEGSLHYVVKVPLTQPPGLYWYHAHVHGQTDYQVGRGGMAGALVVAGIDTHYPGLAAMPERLLVVQNLGSGPGDVRRAHGTPNASPCAPPPAGDLLTVNRLFKPVIPVVAGQPQFFRVVNATGHRTLDLTLRDTPLHVVAIDGYPIDRSPHEGSSLTVSHVVVPPAGRVEFVATPGATSELRTLCYFSGPVGDPDPAVTLARFRLHAGAAFARSQPVIASQKKGNANASLPAPVASRVVRLTEDANGFYINGKAYSSSARPDFVVRTGTVERWTIENKTSEIHAFHIHQVHFLVEEIDGAPVGRPLWRDTVVVPWQTRRSDGTFRAGTVTLMMDFRNPVIRGTFLFHCHILDHEDMGMMAKIQAI